MKKHTPVIGLEIHVGLNTKSKMFCGCKNDSFGAKQPNIYVCPVCLGLPGALPVPNRQAIEWTILIGKALNCKINRVSKFDRKHYFYPDLPKGYQITQYDEPIAVSGKLEMKKSINIRRVHLEEDTGKLLHVGNETLVDFNRSGVPLVEIVTEPDFDNSEDVKRFLEELQVIIRYLDVSDADMEKGSMRLEPNISVKKLGVGTDQWSVRTEKNLPNYKVEVKNINSFRFVKQAIEYEIERQTEILEKGEMPLQETRGFDSNKQVTYSQRTKEKAQDYRYFPEPDIPPMSFDDRYLQQISGLLPELPQEKLMRYVSKFGVREADAFVITRSKFLSAYFEAVLEQNKNFSYAKVLNLPQYIANLIINKKIPTNITIDEFVKRTNELLIPIETDDKALDILINRLIQTNKKVIEDYKKGKVNAIMFLIGQVMREMKGKADANLVISKIKKQIIK